MSRLTISLFFWVSDLIHVLNVRILRFSHLFKKSLDIRVLGPVNGNSKQPAIVVKIIGFILILVSKTKFNWHVRWDRNRTGNISSMPPAKI